MATPQIEKLTSFADLGPVILRDLDGLECERVGMSPTEAISRSIHDSYSSFAIYNGEKLIVMFGYMPAAFGGRTVRIWMLTTPHIEEVKFWFAKMSVKFRDYFLERYPEIEAYVWQGHKPALRWLKWLGFKAYVDLNNPEFVFMRRGRWDS